ETLVKHHVLTTNYQGDYLLCHDLKNLSLLDLADILDVPRQLPKERECLAGLPWGAEAVVHLGAVDQFTREHLDRSVESLFCMTGNTGNPSKQEG
ncbi:MAG TPA: hypothetical protein VIM59_03290, partial [Cellvibrio sp.]